MSSNCVNIRRTVMTDQKRPYRMKRRAEAEEQTRLRITAAAMELHSTVGPSQTSVSAVAERAGVRRSTVYRHFPDETALFAACSAQWMVANPRPDVARWAAVEDPERRLADALQELYAYYRSAEDMLANLHRDEATMPVVRERFAGFHGFLAAASDVLMAGRRRRKQVRAAVGHAVAFTTWRSLAREQGLSDAEAARLICRLVAAS
jgi:AcrR family transcriptional regulator